MIILWIYGILDNFGIILGNTAYFGDLTCVHINGNKSCLFDICTRDKSNVHLKETDYTKHNNNETTHEQQQTKIYFLGYYLVTGLHKVYDVEYTPLPDNLTLQYLGPGGTELLYPQASHVVLNKPNLLLCGKVRKGRVIVNQSQQILTWPQNRI